MKARDFDEKFDADSEDMIGDLDLSSLTRPNQAQRRVSVDFPGGDDRLAGMVVFQPLVEPSDTHRQSNGFAERGVPEERGSPRPAALAKLPPR